MNNVVKILHRMAKHKFLKIILFYNRYSSNTSHSNYYHKTTLIQCYNRYKIRLKAIKDLVIDLAILSDPL